MQVHIVHVHPEPASFNGAMTRAARESLACEGHNVTLSDLYAQGFDPVERGEHYSPRVDGGTFSPLAEQRHASEAGQLPADVAREIERLERADLVIFQFPLWWHQMPAMLKGWMDRVFVNGGLYTSRMRYERGYFKGRRAIASLTTGAPAAAMGPGGRGGDIERLLWPVHYSLHYMGFAVLPPFLAFGVAGHGYSYADDGAFDALLNGHLENWKSRLETIAHDEPLSFPGWGDWDGEGAALTT
ncbi:NAD(P)H-dependent oxidoreductase [Rhizobiales bacterium]|uniref:NAD(P)H-dependent oxidoreductase n=1 Tax=Hongsoonwoonella zoysiae TaxID=2821844 RepID=UPI0015612042|nr:NAD(P)H-dependent oxidoreductase [Hongsoonwoonella zoysiae]NRG17114.1 NAD(P)H-dependent oxidoreductase [Hongsoonwoonella zoysiae]